MRYPRQKLMQKQTSTREKALGGNVAFTFCWKSLWLSLLSDPNSDCEWPENSNWHLLIRPHGLLNQAFGYLGNQSEEGLKNQAGGGGLCGTRWDQETRRWRGFRWQDTLPFGCFLPPVSCLPRFDHLTMWLTSEQI